MSKYDVRKLQQWTRVGFVDEQRKMAWHSAGLDYKQAQADGLVFEGAIPLDVATGLLDWKPEVWDQDRFFSETMNEYVPSRAQRFIGSPLVNEKGERPLLAIHTDGYQVHPYAETLLDKVVALLDAGGQLASVGCLGYGAQAFASWIPNGEVIDMGEMGGIIPYVNAGSSLDGSLATYVGVSAVLQVCDNTASMSLADANRSGRVYKVRHTANSRFDVSAARQALELAVKGAENFADEFERMANMALTDEQFRKLVAEMIEVDEKPGRSRTIALNKRSELQSLWASDVRVAPVKGSVAGAFQAFNTWLRWGDTIRGNSTPFERGINLNRTGEAEALDRKVINAAMSLAGVS
jgi:phage/plasmid-like protein (TIGR03299 family)